MFDLNENNFLGNHETKIPLIFRIIRGYMLKKYRILSYYPGILDENIGRNWSMVFSLDVIYGHLFGGKLITNKLIALTLNKIWSGQAKIEYESIVVTLRKDEITTKIKCLHEDFFEEVKDAAIDLEERRLITYVHLKDDEIELKFHKEIKSYIMNFAAIHNDIFLGNVLAFESNYALMLFEMLSITICEMNKQQNDNKFIIEYNFNELRFDLGLVKYDADEKHKLWTEFKSPHIPDFNKIVKYSWHQSYKTWTPFKENVLLPSLREINKITNMKIKYERDNQCRWGKTISVTFKVNFKNK